MRRIGDTNLVFVHVPKTAGQAVTAAFGLKHLSTDHSIAKDYDLPFYDEKFIRFCVVRHPIDRFISAYRYHLFMTKTHTARPIRSLILENDLGHDVNTFISFVQDTGFDLQSDLHFGRQMRYLRKTRPQIILRQGTLASDIKIVAALAPEHFVGLNRKNASDERLASNQANTDLSNTSLKFLKTFYRRDLDLLGYLAADRMILPKPNPEPARVVKPSEPDAKAV